MYNPFNIKGKNILITGASSGIGKATASEASKGGASLIITGRKENNLKNTFLNLTGDNHTMICGDLNDETWSKEMITQIPNLDGLVVSVGITEIVPVLFSTPKKMKTVFETNFFSPVEFIRLLLKKKKFNKEASIVVLASVGGISVTSYANGVYGASKAALASWIKFLAQELIPKGIRANCVCPGMTETPFIHSGTITETELEEDKKRYILGRYASPEEIAWSIIYLLSDATKWVTGTNLIIDGGISI